MKLELVKETRPDGTILYSIEQNGNYVSRTATDKLEDAEGYFNTLSKGAPIETIKETIKSILLDEN